MTDNFCPLHNSHLMLCSREHDASLQAGKLADSLEIYLEEGWSTPPAALLMMEQSVVLLRRLISTQTTPAFVVGDVVRNKRTNVCYTVDERGIWEPFYYELVKD